MNRSISLAAITLACLATAARQATAETAVTTARTTPIATSTATGTSADDVHVTTAGSITIGSGAAITLDSNNIVNHEGALRILDANDATGILMRGGNTGSVFSAGTIEISDTTVSNVVPLTGGLRRFGIRLTGPGDFNGSITQSAGSITIRGNDSAAISLETGLNGSLSTAGTISVVGDRSYGIHALGRITGAVTVSNSINVLGVDAVGLALDDAVGGKVTLSSGITATGYLAPTRPTTDALLAAVTANDVLQGGAALRVRGSVAGGIEATSTSSISSFGAAPAVLLGGTTAPMQIGLAGTGVDSYGLLLRGTIAGSGVYNNIGAIALQIGGTGAATTIDGGIRNTGTITAGGYTASTASPITVQAVRIDSGAVVGNLANSGTISAFVTGATGNADGSGSKAVAITDTTGSLARVLNSGTILAQIVPQVAGGSVAGTAVAIDLSANTTGAEIAQVLDTATSTPSITGDVLFGSGNDTLNLLGGKLTGAVSFGSGFDQLNIDNGAILKGRITDSDGSLAIRVNNGRLQLTNLEPITVSSLKVGATGHIVIDADPNAGTAGKFIVTGNTDLASGAAFSVSMKSKLTGPASYTLVQSGSLTGSLTGLSVQDLSYFYNGNLVADANAGTITLDLRRRTAAEAGMTVGSAAFDAIFQNYDRDTQIREAFDKASTKDSFTSLYRQMLPDYSGGTFNLLQAAANTMGQLQSENRVVPREGRSALWATQMVIGADRSAGGDAPGYRGGGVLLAGGWEHNFDGIGVLGFSTSYMRGSMRDRGGADNRVVSDVIGGGLNWRDSYKGLTASASVQGNYVSLDGTRNFNATDAAGTAFTRTADSSWSGVSADVRFGLAYLEKFKGFYLRPELSGEYFWLHEGARTEKNGGDGLNLKLNARNGNQFSTEASLTIGTEFGKDGFAWRPELKIGWRGVFGQGPADTIAQFTSSGSAFTLTSQDPGSSGLLGRLSLHGGTQASDVAVEIGGESRSGARAYDTKLVSRFRF